MARRAGDPLRGKLRFLEPIFWAAWQIAIAAVIRFWVPLLLAAYALRLAAELRPGSPEAEARVRTRLAFLLVFYFLLGLVPAWAGKIARPRTLSPWLLEGGFAAAVAIHVLTPRRSPSPAIPADTSPS